jgi:PAS domain S-box-containing protein
MSDSQKVSFMQGASGHAGDALRESEERYRLIVESALDYAIFTTDRDGIITTWPPGAAKVFGWSAEEIVGQPSDRLFVPEDLAQGEYEKERALAAETGVAPDVRWHLRKDGSGVFIDGWTRALRDAEGKVRGFLKIGQDMTQRRQIEAALRDSEARFRTLVISIPQLVFRSRGTGERTWGSPQWEVYSGLSDMASRGFGWISAIHPDDRQATLDAWQDAARTGNYYVEHRIRRMREAEYRWHQTRAVPLAGENADLREWVGTSADVHDLRQLQEQQTLLVAELQHRTRNLLGVVQSLMQQTLAKTQTLDEFSLKFTDRLAALSRVQGLLSRSESEPITIGALIRMELDALGAETNRDRITIDGPKVSLPSSAVQTMSLAIHELATNAQKHGFLSSEEGRLNVMWRLEPLKYNERKLILDWDERGVKKPVEGTPLGGFGRTLIEQALPASLGARTSFEITKKGVRCRIELPLT